MTRRVAVTTLNASTIDILNTIRANASYEYQSSVPVVATENDIPKVGEVLYGYPALANQFLNALMNRIALVRVNSAVFNNAYAELKKGYLELGEKVEEVFVSIAKARVFSAEKAQSRELARTLPDVKAAFHIMNWRVQYPITIQDMDLRQAFLSMTGVQDLIAKIVNGIYTGAEYDEFLLFKYLMIKAISNGKMYPVAFDSADMSTAAVEFRGMSNKLTFMSDKYNAAGVNTVTPKDDQYIFMDAQFNAKFDVEVLAAAFNMDKADFIGRLKLIDDWTTFDTERFTAISAESDMLPAITPEELALMSNVKAVLIDAEWFQIYDNLSNMTEKYVASGMYWNYFYNVWKTVSSSPFSNAIVFVDDAATVTQPASYSVHIDSKDESDEATVLTFSVMTTNGNPTLANTNYKFVQTEAMVGDGVAMHPYGAMIIPTAEAATKYTITLEVDGVSYNSTTTVDATSAAVGTTIAVNKVDVVTYNSTTTVDATSAADDTTERVDTTIDENETT